LSNALDCRKIEMKTISPVSRIKMMQCRFELAYYGVPKKVLGKKTIISLIN